MQNTHCENSPIKEEIKLKQRFSNKSKEFTPTYLRNIPAGQPKDPQQLSMNWQQMFGADTNINNMLEMSCFQLLNEKLAAYTSGRFQKHSYNVSLSYWRCRDIIMPMMNSVQLQPRVRACLPTCLCLMAVTWDTNMTIVNQVIVSTRNYTFSGYTWSVPGWFWVLWEIRSTNIWVCSWSWFITWKCITRKRCFR